MTFNYNIKKIFLILTQLMAFVLVSFSAQAEMKSQDSDVKTVPFVDLQKYTGTWFELAAIPQSFQKKCVKNTTAEYSLEKSTGFVVVKNSCTEKDGSRNVADGRARIDDNDSNAKLTVTFVKLIKWIFTFGGDYWIIGLDNDYRWVVIGHPTREYAWILSRTPKMSFQDWEKATAILKENNYDTCQLLTSIQDGGSFTIRQPLCEVTR